MYNIKKEISGCFTKLFVALVINYMYIIYYKYYN
jgi:hypothetical protein